MNKLLPVVCLAFAAIIEFSPVTPKAHAFTLDNGNSASVNLRPITGADLGRWQLFMFNGVGETTQSSQFEFTAPSTGAIIEITDVFLKGDIFNIYDFGNFIGSTSVVPASTENITFDPDIAFADPTYSHGIFSLASGYHSITVVPAVSLSGTGGAFIRFSAAQIPWNFSPASIVVPLFIGLKMLKKQN
ncbi:MAG TPA: hypothetical protein V6D12_07675 [Candidatus Obscuribacterales bacterium]